MKKEREFKGLAKLPEKEILDRLKPFGSEPSDTLCSVPDWIGAICKHCGCEISIRNPSGKCDHLYWPDMLTDEAKQANGFRLVTRQVWERKPNAELSGGEAVRSDDLLGSVTEIANNAIYFDDNSDYRSALWDICSELGMADNDIGAKFIEAN